MRHLKYSMLFSMAVLLFISFTTFAAEGDKAAVGAEGKWKQTVGGTIFRGQLYTAEDSGELYRTNLVTGEKQQIGNADFAQTVRMYTVGDLIYTIESDGSLYRVNPIDGTWEQVGDEGGWKAAIAGTIHKGQLYTVEDKGELYCTNLQTGARTKIGKAEFGDTMQMFASADKLYIIEKDGTLFGVNPETGGRKGVGAEGDWKDTVTLAILDHWLYTTETDGALYRTNLSTGEWEQVGQANFDKTRRLFAMGSDLYTIDEDGSLHRVAVTSPNGD